MARRCFAKPSLSRVPQDASLSSSRRTSSRRGHSTRSTVTSCLVCSKAILQTHAPTICRKRSEHGSWPRRGHIHPRPTQPHQNASHETSAVDRGGARALGITLSAFGYFYVWPLYSLFNSLAPDDRCPGHEHFNAGIWRDSVQTYSVLAPRGCMVDDLIATHRLRGVPRRDIVALLGEPRPTGYFKKYDLVYWLGPERGPFGIDSEWLVLRLDSTGRVAEARVVTD